MDISQVQPGMWLLDDDNRPVLVDEVRTTMNGTELLVRSVDGRAIPWIAPPLLTQLPPPPDVAVEWNGTSWTVALDTSGTTADAVLQVDGAAVALPVLPE